MTTENLSAGTEPVSVEAPASQPTEVVAKPAVEAPKSMDDTLRSKYSEILKAGAKADEPSVTPEETTEEVVEEVEATEGLQRGPDGKFLPKNPAAPATAAKPAEALKPEVVVPVTQVDGVDITKAPTSLKGSVQQKWSNIDPDVRAEFHRREGDFHKGLQGYKQAADNFKAVDAVVQPYAEMIREANLTVPQVVQEMLFTAKALKTGTPEQKLAVMAQIAKNYGVDPSGIAAAVEQLPAATLPDPRVQGLEQTVHSLSEKLESFQREQSEAQQQTLHAEVTAFASKPENKHYESVKLDMAALLQSGRATDLNDAYNKAIWANPDVRALLIAEQQETERREKAEKAARARKAASPNVAARGSLPATKAVGTMDDTIRSRFRELNAGA